MKLDFGNKNPLTIVYFLYDDGKGKEEHVVYCRIWIKRTKAEMSLNLFCKQTDWDSEHQRFSNPTKHFAHLNYELSVLSEKLEAIYFGLINKGLIPTPKLIRDIHRGKTIDGTKDYSLLEFIDEFIAEIRLKPNEYGPPTIQKYYALKRHLKDFFKVLGVKDIKLSSLSRSILDKFETHLLTVPNETLGYAMNRNTANMYLVKLKTVTNNAIRKQILDNNPFSGLKIKQVKPKKVFLTIEELREIENHPLSDNHALKKVRDLFLFAVYTGLRFSDMMALESKNIYPGEGGQFWISIQQIKTDEPLLIPVLKPAEIIIHKYKAVQEKTGYILPRLSNQKVNDHLKEIGRLVGINKKITHHVGRHTFATTIAMENGLDIKTVSKWLGHASIKTTEVYAHVTKKQLSDSAANLNSKLVPEVKPEVIQELIKASNSFLN